MTPGGEPLLPKEEERRRADDPDGEESDVVLDEVRKRHESETEEHRLPDVHAFAVDEGNEANRAEDQSAHEI